MAVTLTVTQVGRRSVFGDRRVVIADVAFSGTYVAGGTPVTPAMFGLQRIDMIHCTLAPATGLATADALYYSPTTDVAGFLVQYESGAANAPLAEKNEGGLIATQTARVMVVGV